MPPCPLAICPYLRHVFDEGDGELDVGADVDEGEPRDDGTDAEADEHGDQRCRGAQEPQAVATHLLIYVGVVRS